VALSDKQYYYKIIETRMDQFGLNMNFLEIKQVLVIIFTLKINFYFIFLDFLSPGLSARFLRKYFCDSGHSEIGWRVYSLKIERFFCEMGSMKG
jgi:hypothetical protein